MSKLVMTAALQEAATGIGKPADIAITKDCGYRKVCAKWAPKILKLEHKTARKTEMFMSGIITSDESRVHHYGPLTKRR